jgi:tRNA(Ile)-lysidine synthase TilS/MesJ
MRYPNIREEELKLKVAQDFFSSYDCTKIIGNVDFCVSIKQREHQLFEQTSLLWAEAKQGKSDLNLSLVQLILTIGKARTFDTHLPPAYLGAFDAEKIAFIPYSEVHDIFYLNDFNWKVTPSNYETKEFQLVHDRVKGILDQKFLTFSYEQNHKELTDFIKNNFVDGKTEITKTKIDKNNFMVIYNKWLSVVKPSIAVNWEIAKKNGIIDGDFYLADLLSNENESLKESLFVLLKKDHYELDRKIDSMGLFTSSQTGFNDKQKAHHQFWNKYERPPAKEYWDYIVERRDLLVPQDVRERKGSYFTPQIWVELSQKYLTDVLGEDWQDEYYVWDCAAGTGNLLAGLTNKYNIWASTLDKQDVEVMKDRIKNGANLLEDHVFQFDFLNDDFDKLPKPLKAIIDDSEKRKKLVIYINPPYAEGDARIGKGRKNIHESRVHVQYQSILKKASSELFSQFFIRIYFEIKKCKLAEFSKLKILQAPNYSDFRNIFKASLEKMFVVPADTFDNVKGQFPIGFMIWDTSKGEVFKETVTDVYDRNGKFIGTKGIHSFDDSKYVSDWLEENSKNISKNHIGHLASVGNDFQNQNTVFIDDVNKKRKKGGRHTMISSENLMVVSIYFTVRHCIPATWLNDRDQFLYPNDGWQGDTEFQNDCLTYTLFNNNIQSAYGTNHWIPFTEQEVNAREKFDSNFMTQFIKGKLKPEADNLLIVTTEHRTTPLVFSPEAQAVFDAGRELWKYYHAQPNCNVNASLYDIREHFQGRNEKGKMNNKSSDIVYMGLIGNLRLQLDDLALKVQPKVYEYGFLKG